MRTRLKASLDGEGIPKLAPLCVKRQRVETRESPPTGGTMTLARITDVLLLKLGTVGEWSMVPPAGIGEMSPYQRVRCVLGRNFSSADHSSRVQT